jgi:hypothetical protein
MTDRADAVRQLRELVDAFEQTVKEAGEDGAPAGPMYAAFMEIGGTLAQFEAVMAALVAAGRLKKRGHIYFAA